MSNPHLIVIDMLSDFFDDEIWPNSIIPQCRERLAERVNATVKVCRKHQIPVVWFRQEFHADLSNAFYNMQKEERSYTIVDTPGCEILPELDVHDEDEIRLKSRFSAFFNTDFHEFIASRQCRHIILAGITTAWCIRTTATDAYQHNLDVTVISDATQGFTAEAHEESLRAMHGYIANCISLEEFSTTVSP